MKDKSTTNERDESLSETSIKEDNSVSSPRVKTVLTAGLAIKSGVRAGGGGTGPKVPPATGE